MGLMKYWIKTTAAFSSEESDLTGKEEEYYDDFSFDSREVIAYNRSSDRVYTCIRMKSGFDITVKIPFDTFEGVLEQWLKD